METKKKTAKKASKAIPAKAVKTTKTKADKSKGITAETKKRAVHHKKAAQIHTTAAKHHLETAKHYEAGNTEKADKSKAKAHGIFASITQWWNNR